jgi:plastocyanin
VASPSGVGSDATGLEWAAGWTVFVDAGTPPTGAPRTGGIFIRGLAAPVSVTEVSSTIVAADGHVLTTLVTSAVQISVMNFIAVDTGTTQVTPERGIVVNQHVLYDLSAPSPTSQARITVRLTDGNAKAHEVQIANEIRQERAQPGPCTTRGQPSSSGVRIGPSGLDPIELSASLGTCVVFVNQDTVAHDIRSAPHPAHSNCPALNVGLVPPGKSSVTLAINTWGSCGYHDELAPDDERFEGHLVIEAPR